MSAADSVAKAESVDIKADQIIKKEEKSID